MPKRNELAVLYQESLQLVGQFVEKSFDSGHKASLPARPSYVTQWCYDISAQVFPRPTKNHAESSHDWGWPTCPHDGTVRYRTGAKPSEWWQPTRKSLQHR